MNVKLWRSLYVDMVHDKLVLQQGGQLNGKNRELVLQKDIELQLFETCHSKLKDKESKTESIVENLQVQLWKSEFEHEAYLAAKCKATAYEEWHYRIEDGSCSH